MSEPLQYYVATPVRRAQSRVGIASFSLGVLSAILLALALVLRRDGFSDHDIMVALVPLHIPFLGLTLGIAGICSRERKRGLAIAGVAMNGVLALFSVMALLAVASLWIT